MRWGHLFNVSLSKNLTVFCSHVNVLVPTCGMVVADVVCISAKLEFEKEVKKAEGDTGPTV